MKVNKPLMSLVLGLSVGTFSVMSAGSSGAPTAEVLSMPVESLKRGPNRPYVAEGPGGYFYAKAVPGERFGPKGITKIYRVQAGDDLSLDQYEWYAVERVKLGWSPTAGKVAVLVGPIGAAGGPPQLTNETINEKGEIEAPKVTKVANLTDNRVELSLYLGGKLVRHFTVGQLMALGAKLKRVKDDSRPRLTDVKIVDCVQIPGTNEYDFIVKTGSGNEIRIDIVTGAINPIRKRQGETNRDEPNAGGEKAPN
jgi:hypothetical protein